jgi:hypothetical protein
MLEKYAIAMVRSLVAREGIKRLDKAADEALMKGQMALIVRFIDVTLVVSNGVVYQDIGHSDCYYNFRSIKVNEQLRSKTK